MKQLFTLLVSIYDSKVKLKTAICWVISATLSIRCHYATTTLYHAHTYVFELMRRVLNSYASAPHLSNRLFYDTHRWVAFIRNRLVAVFYFPEASSIPGLEPSTNLDSLYHTDIWSFSNLYIYKPISSLQTCSNGLNVCNLGLYS